MNIISEILQEKSKHGSCALIPFVTAGYPNIFTTIQVIYTLVNNGADILELGIPYSDSLADGPLIQESSRIALKQGVYVDQVLDLLSKVNASLKVPVIIFSYYNPILVRGVHKFITEISNVGVKGLIIPDLPIEETDYLICLCIQYNIELILFLAPTSSNDRMLNILSKAPGCIYLVSNTGVTGIRNDINNSINNLSDYIKSRTSKLIMLGFGISNIVQVSQMSRWNIDGIVIGSAFIRIISQYNDYTINKINNKMLKDLSIFCKNIKSAIKH